MRKILIANRGEAAVRIARACRDAGLATVAVYAVPDRDAPHVRLCDEAYALDGEVPATTYLDIGKLIGVARAAGADAVHPGWGFLAENADFAAAVLAAGLVWIGPSPQVIRNLGDKVTARQLARQAGAPLAPGTTGPVDDAAAVAAFAERHGLPVAIKAAHGGGGRGMKVVRSLVEIPEAFAAAVRESVAAFGRGECFAERYLDRPRHVETQCLADAHGDVVVISTRDCSLQRRHQKLVEEAPAPYLSAEQQAVLYETSKALLRAAGYVGAGTCEFLVDRDGLISFLEVNTRLQVEHPVSEEVTGLDLVREMLRIADGQRLGYADPSARGHAVEFRINGEDPGRGFLPGPGTVERWRPPEGPGVRVDSGVEQGTVIGPAFDSLLAKLIVTGADREQALERARRALAEFEVAGLATTLPFHRAVVRAAAFVGPDFAVHTQWIEQESEPAIPPYEGTGAGTGAAAGEVSPAAPSETVVVEVNGRRVEIRMPALAVGHATGNGVDAAGRAGPARRAARGGRNGASTDAVVSPMQGTIVKVMVADGQQVAQDDVLLVLEAMKMEQPIVAHRAGTVGDFTAATGHTVQSGAVLCTIREAPE